MPITEWKDRYAGAPWFVKLPPSVESGLAKQSAADAFQVRSAACQRFVRRLGLLTAAQMADLGRALADVLAIES